MSTFGHSINGILISPMPAHRHQSLSAIAVPLPRPRSPSGSTTKPFTSFFIRDILGSKLGQPINLSALNHHHLHHLDVVTSSSRGSSISPRSVTSNFSPWSPRPTTVRSPPITTQSSPTPTSNNIRSSTFTKQAKKTGSKQQQGGSPLSALEELANKTFTGLETSILRAAEATTSGKRDPLHLFNRQPPRKKRKSRTAFTNQQIFELERRFLYQKYLTPADRDEIATTLGLSNAQVITWFQNRRAKLKRDMEELKADVVATSDPEVINTCCLKASIIDDSVKGIIADSGEEKRKDSQGNEEPLITSQMLDNQRVDMSNDLLTGEDFSSNSSERATNNDDMSRESSVISRDSSVTSRDSSLMSRDSSMERLHDTDGCDEVEAMDCTTSPCSDHSDEESEE